jgi:amidase
MTDLAFLPAHELARRLRRRELSSLELLDHYLARIARLGGPINAVVVLDAERARARARAADDAQARGTLWGPLHGLPMTVKESFNISGLPTTYGHAAHRDNIASSDALLVQRLQDSGAVVFGKTNVPTALADWQSFNPVYGTTCNPWDTARTPGGSSGGAAAALAAGFTGLELGSDIGASIRNPAHYCGVWGHKPTWGVLGMAGHELTPQVDADHFDIAAVGPMARSAHDLALAMDVLAASPTVWTPMGRVPVAWRDPGTAPRQCRVAVLYDDAQAEVDASVQQGLRGLVDFLRSEGVQFTEDARPVDSAEANDVYTHLLRAATGSHYDDASYASAQARAAQYGPQDQHYAARHFRGNTFSHRDWVQMDARRTRLQQQWAAFFQRFDLLICPVATTPAFVHNQQGERWDRMVPVNGHTQPSTDALFWAGYPGIVGLPATAIPLGLSPQGLPVGAQVIAPAFADPLGLRFAQWVEDGFRRFVPPPGL